MRVIEKTGNAALCETPERKKFKHNTSFLKWFATRDLEKPENKNNRAIGVSKMAVSEGCGRRGNIAPRKMSEVINSSIE